MRRLAAAILVATMVAGCTDERPASSPSDARRFHDLPVLSLADLTTAGWGAEPSVEVGVDGTIYVTAPGGEGDADRASRLWVSRDGGATFAEIEALSAETGVSNLPFGLEGDLAVDAAGTAYFVDLSLANTQLAASRDAGATWMLANPAVFAAPGGDRPWVAAGPVDTVAVAWNELPSGYWVAVSTDAGLTFPTQTYFPGTQFVGVGPVARGWTFAGVPAYGPDGTLSVVRPTEGGPTLYRSTDGGATFSEHRVYETDERVGYLMAQPAVDAAGNVYVGWAQPVDGNTEVLYAWSRDGGEAWSAPVRLSHHDGSSVMPWIAAGREGLLAAAYFAAPGAPGVPDETDAPWYAFATIVEDAASDTPRMSVVQLADASVIEEPICVNGLSCNADPNAPSRALADYLQVDVGPDDRTHAVWGDEDGHVWWALVEAP